VNSERVIVVGDAHLGSADPADERAFHDFLAAAPGLGTRLLILGDLFDFWFEYRAVIPRKPFRTLARLADAVDRGLRVELFGGNHDRWGGDFWDRDLGIAFHREGADLVLAGRAAHAVHGDGLAETRLGGRLIHRVFRSPLTVGTFRALHPDLGFRLADRLSGGLAEGNRSAEAIAAAAAAQERWARRYLDGHPATQLVVMGHTHRRALVETTPGRFYLNAGQWMGDRHYAVVTAGAITLHAWPERPGD
jgi:UDP-2,3-diacylglucosamine hydrolase